MNTLANVKILLGITDTSEDALLTLYLEMAELDILRIMYPYGVPTTVTEIPEKYYSVHMLMVIFLYNIRGAEGQSSHNENGINRSYEAGSFYPHNLVSQITPFAVGV